MKNKLFTNDVSSRIPFYDVAKGIGIILVVFGHLTTNNTISAIIYSFHMPFFFFVSGVFAKPQIRLKDYLIKNTKRTLVPFFCCICFRNSVYCFCG